MCNRRRVLPEHVLNTQRFPFSTPTFAAFRSVHPVDSIGRMEEYVMAGICADMRTSTAVSEDQEHMKLHAAMLVIGLMPFSGISMLRLDSVGNMY